jgi:hypothetical protein
MPWPRDPLKSDLAVAIFPSTRFPVKVGRNQPCPCASGRKFKHCHGQLDQVRPLRQADIEHVLEVQRAQERIRQAQQGLGREIIGALS